MKDAAIYIPIGHVENAFDEPAEPDVIASAEARITLAPPLAEGLEGVEEGQQLMVVFHFHRSSGYELRQHPRRDTSRRRRGVFGLRSPHRPNPIGVTMVDVLAVEGHTLRGRGLDVINGTPVLGLKPACT